MHKASKNLAFIALAACCIDLGVDEMADFFKQHAGNSIWIALILVQKSLIQINRVFREGESAVGWAKLLGGQDPDFGEC